MTKLNLTLQRLPFPAAPAAAALRDIIRPASVTILGLPLWRCLLFLAFGFQLMARADTNARMNVNDIIITPSDVRIALMHEKCRRHLRERRQLVVPIAANPLLHRALVQWHVLRKRAWSELPLSADAGSFWLLPAERITSPSASCSSWMDKAITYLGLAPPAGGKWTSHSLRSGAASACNAINVPLPTTRYWGGWAASSAVVNDYIDPTIQADDAAYLFFGWLLPQPRSTAAI